MTETVTIIKEKDRVRTVNQLAYGLVVFLLMCCGVGHAQTTATQLSIGGVDVLDTYLSPEKYHGVEWRFVSEVNRDSRKHQWQNGVLTYNLTHEGAFAYVHNRVGNTHEYVGHYDFSYAVSRKWNLLDDDLHIDAGAMVDAFVGFNYNDRNGNNPAQGYGSLALGMRCSAAYTFTLFSKRITASYEARIPFVGVMFSPNYGQSYYEMFNLGNYDHNIVAYSVSPLQLRQQLAFDIPVARRTSLRIGYMCDIRQAKPNNLKQHHYYNAATIGVVIRKD